MILVSNFYIFVIFEQIIISDIWQGIYFIGRVKYAITKCKIPSNGDVTNILFYNIRYRKFSLTKSTILVIQEVLT